MPRSADFKRVTREIATDYVGIGDSKLARLIANQEFAVRYLTAGVNGPSPSDYYSVLNIIRRLRKSNRYAPVAA